MRILALSILIIFSLTGFIAIFFTTFGTFIMLLGAGIYAALTGFSIITVKTFLVLLALYLAGEVSEYFFIIAGAKRTGASNAAVGGAIIGGIAGAVFGAAFFGVGIILGTFLGIFLGAFFVELITQRDIIKSLRSGTGGVLGRIGSVLAKLVIAVIMLIITATRLIGYR